MGVIISPVYIIRSGLYKAIAEIAPAFKGDILDFGCGSKPYESLFINAHSYTGVDLQTSGHNHKDSKVDYYYDGKTLPFPDKKFDAVVSFEVLDDIFNLDEILSEIYRVLKPGGQFFISVAFAWDEHEPPNDYARYTSYGISHVINKNKFEITKIRKTGTYFLAVGQLLIAYLYQHALPRKGVVGRSCQLFFIFPITLFFILFNILMPKRYEYYCNTVILATK